MHEAGTIGGGRGTTDRERYAAAWRQLGLYRLLALAVLALPMPGLVANAYLNAQRTPASENLLPWLALLILCFNFSIAAYAPIFGVRCPRCGSTVNGGAAGRTTRRGRCNHCGLAHFADPNRPETMALSRPGPGSLLLWLAPVLSVPFIAIILSAGLDNHRRLACPEGTWVAGAPWVADVALKAAVCVAATAIFAWFVYRQFAKAAWWGASPVRQVVIGVLVALQVAAAAAAIPNGLAAVYCVGWDGMSFRAGLLGETKHYAWTDMRRLRFVCRTFKNNEDVTLTAEMPDGQVIFLADGGDSPFWGHLDTFAIAVRQHGFDYGTNGTQLNCPARYRVLLTTYPTSWHALPR